jgi:large subunit ribosomal protein L4e
MKLRILGLNKENKGEKELPVQFNEEIRQDLIKRAVLAIKANKRQPYGASPEAGKRASAKLSRRRHDYKGAYGYGISRVPRKILSRRGTRFNWVGAFAPGTVGGRRAHPPKAEKQLKQKINKKERRKAIRSAISATVIKELVEKRNHKVPEEYPFIISSDIENIEKIKELRKILESLGLKEELKRCEKKKVRAGKGKIRGRKYKKKTGPLIVVSERCNLMKKCTNIAGVNIEIVNKINTEILAPGAEIGRLTFFTDKAINKMEKEKLFL